MADTLDEEWRKLRGIEVVAVAVSSISYTDDSQKLINMRNQGAMLGDPSVREGYMQGAVARGIEAAGSNTGGAMQAFMGMGMGMNQAGDVLGQASASNQAQMAQQEKAATKSENTWTCSACGTENAGKFCSNCGEKKPEAQANLKIEMACSACNAVVNLANGVPKFCPECGQPFVAKPL